jgi:hypothetical protein
MDVVTGLVFRVLCGRACRSDANTRGLSPKDASTAPRAHVLGEFSLVMLPRATRLAMTNLL